ncbi:HNH endonuclease [Clostridium tyrobutyricum]|uniref:HNH endonuclease n=1 Tax=Clostridium tyrobutyricum TaxID=1519 RepID=UPI0030CC5BE6
MKCINCLFKENICKRTLFIKNNAMPLPECTILCDITSKGYIDKNDRDIYNILSECTSKDVCYYEYSEFIYNRFKNSFFTSMCERDSSIKFLINILYKSYGNPEDDNNMLQKLTINNIENTLNKVPYKTETTSIINTRLSQDLFRKKLFLYDPKCKICGLTKSKLLIASHSKNWSYSTDKERTDVYNGFLLCPQHDALYDKGLISFDDDGNILISSEISINDYNLLNINENIKINITKRHKKYLKWHREHKFKC